LPQTDALTDPLPGDGGSDNHYFAARAANAARVQFGSPLDCVRPMDTEKFLFYRGVGDFQTPLHLRFVSDSDGRQKLSLINNGPETLSGLHIVHIKDGQGAIRRIDSLAPGKSILRPLPFDPQPLSRVIEELSASMHDSLVTAGLYDSEAAAMIDTWRDAWFEEEGLRVLHLLPTEWTDRTLPLQLDPAPRDIVRVMVGRAEIFTPDTEQKLESLFAGREGSDSDNVADAIQDLGLGRFVEPAFTRLANLESDRIRNQVNKFSNEVRSAMHKQLNAVKATVDDQTQAVSVRTAGL
ncbi:MAG TPA: hypothetical protein VMS21_02165, partial [Methylomirabilota bacterium]|nr:hypothetical protein [Methylomirabilota bacterium]